jgi:hypothetical protein
MIEIRYANELGGVSSLAGNPVMSSNCYYIAGRAATFSDNRPGSTLSNVGLAAWKTHISGESGTIEVDPALDPVTYVTTNPQCAGMGIQDASALPVGTPTDPPEPPTDPPDDPPDPPTDPPVIPPTDGTVYNIADFYNTSGQLSVQQGDIIIVGQRVYIVLSETATISYWSQSSLSAAISWWTEYMDSYAADGVVEEFIGPPTEPGGVSINGAVASYNPNTPTTISLMQGEVIKYPTITIPATSGRGQTEGTFSFEGVAPGTYSIVISKPGHTSYTLDGIIVGEENIILTQDERPEVQLMVLRCGDIDGDGMINDKDLSIMWSLANYNRKTENAANTLCDLNGDNMINDVDLTVLWKMDHYNRGEKYFLWSLGT